MKLNKKRLAILTIAGVLMTSTLGVAAASGIVRSKGLLSYNGGEIVVDGDAIGAWVKDDTNWKCAKYASGNTNPTITIQDADIKEDSIIDLYYDNADLSMVANAEPIYTQTTGQLKIQFNKPQKITDEVNIDYIKITNPVNTTKKQ